MPTDVVTVTDVFETPTKLPGVMRYDINARMPGLGQSYETTDPWLASLCQRAKDTDQSVALTWKHSRYGKQIVQARLLTEGDVAFERALESDREAV